MKQTGSRAVQEALKYIDQNYGFMLRRGYEVLSAEDADVGWQAVLRKSDLFVQILRTRGDEYVFFRAGAQPLDEFVDIGSVVYAATGEKIPVSYEDYSGELQKYLDRIEAYFEGEYLKNKRSLAVARQEYSETLPQVEVIPPEEPKIIPILHYPLMGIVLLLLFGALTTLYMVLLDRLFAAFSWDPDAYTLYMGVGSPLLAIGTMLLFRARRKKD